MAITTSRSHDAEARTRRLLQLVADHPWLDTHLLEVFGEWTPQQVKLAASLGLKRGWLESIRVPSRLCRPQTRLGLTPVGADQIGFAYNPQFWRATLLGVLQLDPARCLLARLKNAAPLLWSLSPFTLPGEAVSSPRNPAPKKKPSPQGRHPRRYVSIPLQALACVKVIRGDQVRYANLAVIVNPGGISLEWFAALFRSALAWRRHPNFRPATGLAPEHAFPVFVVIAANPERQVEIGRLWREAAQAFPWEVGPRPYLRLTTWGQVMDDLGRANGTCGTWLWRTEHGQMSTLWSGVALATEPCIRPQGPRAPWWGNRATSEAAAALRVEVQPGQKRRGKSQRGIIAGQREILLLSADTPGDTAATDPVGAHSLGAVALASLVHDHLKINAQGRWLLDRVGLYPLIIGQDLALVLGCEPHNTRQELRRLQARGLIEHPAKTPGWGLTWRGLSLLAAQAGFGPVEYARLRRWPVKPGSKGQAPQLQFDLWLKNYEHTQLTLAFLVGLRRAGPGQRLALVKWEHTPYAETFPGSGRDSRMRRLIPDARGLVWIFGNPPSVSADTAFWLEIDRGTVNGAKLKAKLARYYTVGGPGPGARGRSERLLIVTPPDDEGRLQALRRRIRDLDQRYMTELNVRFARLDQLDEGHGRMDPTRRVWRRTNDSAFSDAFNQPGTP